MTGERFGHIVVLRDNIHGGKLGILVEAKCDCGNVRKYPRRHVRYGRIKTCGCRFGKMTPKELAVASIWYGIKQRCYNANADFYELYGGAGITVAPEWKDDFAAFFAYLGPRPSSGHSVDRFPDPHGNYEPGNVRWATMQEQQRNRRDNYFVWRGNPDPSEVRRVNGLKAQRKYQKKKSGVIV